MTGFNELMDGRVDGAVVLGFRTIPQTQLEVLRRSGLPVVLMSQQKEVPGFFQLLAGTYERTLLAAEKLLDMGHRRIGYMGFYEESLHEEMVKKAMEDAFRKRHLKLTNGWRECSEKWNIWDVVLIERQLNKLLDTKCTAIICVSADQAMLAVEILKRRGIKVPQDISLAAFGPLSFVAQFQRSTLCLIEADLFKAGSQVYEMYKEAQQGKKHRSIAIEWNWLGQGDSPPSVEVKK
jgi:DNA-binding LacI/PurR family transcriptional regulator